MFTRHPLSIKDAKDEDTPFGQAHSNINAILNTIAPYSEQAELNPFETCEFPADMKKIGGKCLVFDGYSDYSADVAQDFGLLAIIEVFRSEIEFAREKGGEKLIAKLRQAGHYPYSDMDRDSVV
jgi:hypothetical protein